MTSVERREAEIKRIMLALKCSREEAEDIVREDEVIDTGGRTDFDFDIKTEKEALKLASALDRKKMNRAPNTRPLDENKVALIQTIASAISAEFPEFSIEISTPDRLIELKDGKTHYTVMLTKHRTPKST